MMEFSHQELSLMLFALEGSAARAQASSETASCEESCPIVEDLDDLFGGGSLPHEKKLARHLNNHLREGLIECGVFELIASKGNLSGEQQVRLQEANERLKTWRCEIKLDAADFELLRSTIGRLPRSAWFAMPRTLWRLKRKLKNGQD
ncbi:MAG TPA: hypothetical protein VFQ92_00850 [Blastocatellia bacterium]|nr:hypothetical protein [Blastocatellia bacterium]